MSFSSLTELKRGAPYHRFSSLTRLNCYDGGVTLPSAYPSQHCSVARALEVLGERWTLLIVRDAFYGVRRFQDFVDHLDIPRAVLTARLKSLESEGVLQRVPGSGKRTEYALTDKGLALWPVVRGLASWGNTYYSPAGPIRLLRHDTDGGALDDHGRCTRCGTIPPPGETIVEAGPGFGDGGGRTDPVSQTLHFPHRLLEPIHADRSTPTGPSRRADRTDDGPPDPRPDRSVGVSRAAAR